MGKKVVHKSMVFKSEFDEEESLYIACNTKIELPDDNYDWSCDWDEITCRRCLSKRAK
jgi:hypothetical protein